VYTSLRRLEHKGLVSSIQVLVSGRTRRVFEITPAGRNQLAADWAVWEEFTGWSAVSCTITRKAGARNRQTRHRAEPERSALPGSPAVAQGPGR
jgi:DNA-binding PadR family transcriptional regulator